SAGCAQFQGPNASVLMQQFGVQAELLPASFHLVSDDEGKDPIVGFWKVTLSVQGQTVDSAFVQWHNDGTELMNSSRSPATGSFCMGVWKRQEGRNYKLNHFALSFDPNGNLVGPANIREKITLDPTAQAYSGTFILDQFDTSGNVLAHVAGDIAAFR